jgi:glycosyltransferase involved in cell wall biosynthesis
LPRAGVNNPTNPWDRATVAVIIPTYNHAGFLAAAIESVLAQTRPANEIIVVDDGSADDPAEVVAQFPQVRLIRQDNRGLSAARNVGLRNCTTSHVVFLDADDRLLPIALQTGLEFARTRPDCAFVYGGHRDISENGDPIGHDLFNPVNGDAHIAFLRRNLVGALSSAVCRRDCLLAVDGFDETLRRLEDHDIYLRISEKFPVASHPETVAEYRKHGQNMSSNSAEQLKVALQVLRRHEARITHNALTRAAIREGRRNKRAYYVSAMLSAAFVHWHQRHDIGVLVKNVIEAAWWSPLVTVRVLLGVLGRRGSKALRI